MDTQNATWPKKWPEAGPDQGVGDDAMSDTQGVGGKQYFWGLDLGVENDFGIVAECHRDADGLFVIDRIIEPKPELGNVPANQGL